MKVTIEIDESKLKRYDELAEERKLKQKDMHERIGLYKGKIKKLEKDVIYKQASYEFIIAGIEQNDIRDKIFEQIYKACTESNHEQ